MPSTSKYAIIVAGGSGKRMGSKIPKQFLEIKGRPILVRTLEVFEQCSKDIRLILVLPEQHLDTWGAICERYHFHASVTLVIGGDTRFQSVKKGLEAIEENQALVAIHDGVRPLVDTRIIEESFEIAASYGSAIATAYLKDSIRQINTKGSRSVDREQFRLVQTPQTFKVEPIKKAYQITEQPVFHDDASVWEAAGNEVVLFNGSDKNLKITTIQDLLIAEVLMKIG